jgi:exodeoxyribonuclease-5
MTLEEIIEGTMQRVLKTFCEGFEVWWARIPEARRVLLLDQAVGDNPHFTIQSRSLIERSVRDTPAICDLLSVIAADFGLDEYDAKRVRQYRNKLAHQDRTERGQLHYMRLNEVEDCVDSALRLVRKFGADPQYAQLQRLSEYVIDRLTGGTTAPAAPPTASNPDAPTLPLETRLARPEVVHPPRLEDPPFKLPPTRSKGPSTVTVIDVEKLSPDQREAVEKAVQWFRMPGAGTGAPFAISGPAGSGKSTVLSAIIERLRLQADAVVLAAPTGKAVEAIKARMPRGWRSRARTLASFLWKFRMSGYQGEDAKFIDEGAKPLDPKIALVIVDEASMVTHRDRDALKGYRRVLYIGDADQLPPVVTEEQSAALYGSGGVLDRPDAVLRTVHRQDADSSVLRVANDVRSGRQPEHGVSADGHVIMLSEERGHVGVDELDELLSRSDVVLTQRNSLRVAINEYVRWKRGHMRHPLDFVPKAGEILVSSENYFDSRTKCKVSNGERLIVERVLGLKQVREDVPELQEYRIQAHPEGRQQESQEWVVSSQMLAGDHIRAGVVMTEHVTGPKSGVLRADWGYALTVHKAQGSEWPHVLVVDDHNPDHQIPREKWYYVAYSRASAQLAVLQVRPETLLFTIPWAGRPSR